jgi:hypothetical protein
MSAERLLARRNEWIRYGWTPLAAPNDDIFVSAGESPMGWIHLTYRGPAPKLIQLGIANRRMLRPRQTKRRRRYDPKGRRFCWNRLSGMQHEILIFFERYSEAHAFPGGPFHDMIAAEDRRLGWPARRNVGRQQPVLRLVVNNDRPNKEGAQ